MVTRPLRFSGRELGVNYSTSAGGSLRVEIQDAEGRSLLDAMMDGELDGMQYFDGELEKLVRAGVITLSTAYLYATNAGNLRVQLADVADEDSSSIESVIVR